ncbi:MAG TPA: hypothetical protein IAC62_16875 [Candidatus Pelethocola excrementipullorum]|nr:hypothetical protein [Candidatus Pelethocola excrementipullorum]
MEEQKNSQKFSPILWFKGLPAWIRGVVINVAVMLLLVMVFFMVGNYLYGPAKSARGYYEAKLSEDWNGVYDNCKFPESPFLSRQNFINANSYVKGGVSAQSEMPEITSYMMRKKQSDGNTAVYQVNYSLKGDGEAHIESLSMERGSSVLKMFNNWYVTPEDLYIRDVKITVPEDARLVIDGIDVTEKHKEKSEDSTKAVYKVPYLFLGWHTVELKEPGKENYREIFQLKEQKALEFIPELQLNNQSGKEICDQAEEALEAIYAGAASNQDFDKISKYFAGDKDTQKAAKKAYEDLTDQFSTKKSVGIATLSVTRVTTSVQNKEELMHAEIEVNYTAEKVSKWFFFFYDTENYSDSVVLKSQVTKEDGKWVFDAGIIPAL